MILGFEDQGHKLVSIPRPQNVPEITQDNVNSAIRRFSEPEFHSRVSNVLHPLTCVQHPIIIVPASDTPVMSKRSQPYAKVQQHRFYTRKPGPRTEEPQTAEEWRELIDRCIRARRQDMLDAIRSIVVGTGESQTVTSGSRDVVITPSMALGDYSTAARNRWAELTAGQPVDSPSRFPKGYYEMGFALVGARPVDSPNELKERLKVAQKRELSGWPPFLDIGISGQDPYIYDELIEAWLGREKNDRPPLDSYESDFWRASLDGKLYTIRGYSEDRTPTAGRPNELRGSILIDLPIIRIAEGILFACRLSGQFKGVEQLAVACRFTGLNGRSLVESISSTYLTVHNSISHTSEKALSGQATLQQVQDNLPEVIYDIVKPLYEVFGFYQVSIGEVRRILNNFIQA